MTKLMRRWWKYLTARLTGKFEESADPKVQLEQAIQEAYEQDRRLKEQAGNVIANQKLSERRLDQKEDALNAATANARQALLLSDEATKAGDTEKASQFGKAAETAASQLIALESEVESLKAMVLEATRNSDAAKSAVQQNSVRFKKLLAEKQRLLSQLDQAKMQEQMNKVTAQLDLTMGEDVPSFDEVRQKIEGRLARAQGHADVQNATIDTTMREVENAVVDAQAQARLAQLRDQLGLPGAPAAASAEPTAPAPAPAEQPASSPAEPPSA